MITAPHSCRRQHTNKDLSYTCDEEWSFFGRARNNAECEDSYIYVFSRVFFFSRSLALSLSLSLSRVL